jgi:DNA-binding HxlR family transcriptional regulator
LDLLVEEWWIERHVTNEKPLKITYTPTKVWIELSQKLEDLWAWIKTISK